MLDFPIKFELKFSRIEPAGCPAMSDDKRISGGDDPRSVLREEDLAWLACVASAGDGLLVLAHEDGSPVTVETLRRCLALGVIEPMASRDLQLDVVLIRPEPRDVVECSRVREQRASSRLALFDCILH